MHASTVFYLSLVKRILHYLKGSVGREIIMTNNGGFYVFVGGNLISWHSKKQLLHVLELKLNIMRHQQLVN